MSLLTALTRLHPQLQVEPNPQPEVETRQQEVRTVSGTAVAYNIPADIDGGRFSEVIAPGAFTNLTDPFIRLTREHSDRLLARTGSRTLRLFDGPRSLDYQASLPDTEDGRAVAVLSARGDYPGVSIGFYADREEWSRDGRHRQILGARLDHLAVVASPAFPTTTLFTASREGRTEGGLEIRNYTMCPAPPVTYKGDPHRER